MVVLEHSQKKPCRSSISQGELVALIILRKATTPPPGQPDRRYGSKQQLSMDGVSTVLIFCRSEPVRDWALPSTSSSWSAHPAAYRTGDK